MSMSLLATKLYIPPFRPNLVTRARLLQKLEEGLRLGSRLILLSAPAGFGKTTLVTEWIESLHIAAPDGQSVDPGVKIAWLSLDEGDNDLATFLAYLVAALQGAAPGVGEGTRKLLDNNPLPAPEALLLPLLNDLARLSTPLILTLDDYHAIQLPAIHEAVAFLIERRPPNVQIIITTRQDPLLPLTRWRARGLLLEIRLKDLRFSEQEAAEFLNRTMGLSLTVEDIAILENRTEGWIAGLQLAAVSLQQSSGGCGECSSDFIQSFSGNDRYVMDYLVDEALCCLSDSVVQFLLQTSILERFNASLCQAVLQSAVPLEGMDALAANPDSAAARLDYLDRSNLFLIPLDNRREWYRYHHLLAELLRFRLKAENSSEKIAELHRRAAHWYAENGLTGDAVAHAAMARDFEWLADLLEKISQSPATWSSGEVNQLLRWLATLPPGTLEAHPKLCLHISRALHISGSTVEGVTWLERAECGVQAWPPSLEKDHQLGIILSNRATYAAMAGKELEAAASADEALRLLPAEDALWRMRTLYARAMTFNELGDLPRARQVYEQVIEMSQRSGNTFLALSSMGSLTYVLLCQGLLRQARRYCQQALELGTVDGKMTPAASMLLIALGAVQFECFELEAAESSFRAGIELAEQGGIGLTLTNAGWLPALVAIRWMLGNSAGAQDALQQLDQSLAAGSRYWRHKEMQQEAQRAHLALLMGDVPTASAWARRYEAEGATEFNREDVDMALARVYLAECRPAQALSLLERLLPEAEQAGRGRNALEMMILQALALCQLEQRESGLAALRRAVINATAEGQMRLFVQEGEALRVLLEELRAGQNAEPGWSVLQVEFVERLLSAFPHDRGAAAAVVTGPLRLPVGSSVHKSGLVEPLTERELEVLRLIGEGLSNAEIARKLYLSPNTLKAHTQNIYSKLDVHSRVQAANKARELGMLDMSS